MPKTAEIPATMTHDAGAYARCSRCGRYSLDPNTLAADRYQPICGCGEQHYWSGSFEPPGPDALWWPPQDEEFDTECPECAREYKVAMSVSVAFDTEKFADSKEQEHG